MGTRQSIRVMRGQKAAIHGLILAGIPYLTGCKIVGVHHERMQPYVARDWRRGRHPLPVKSLPPFQRKIYDIMVLAVGGDAAYDAAINTKRKSHQRDTGGRYARQSA